MKFEECHVVFPIMQAAVLFEVMRGFSVTGHPEFVEEVGNKILSGEYENAYHFWYEFMEEFDRRHGS